MKKTKVTVDLVPIILQEADGYGNDIIQLCEELADEADKVRIEKFGNK